MLGHVTEPGPWQIVPGPMVQEVPVWSPAGDAVLYHPARGPGWRATWWRAPDGEWRLLPLDGEAATIQCLPVAATFLRWAPAPHLVYVHANQLWRAELRDGTAATPHRLSEEAALYPSVARDGTIMAAVRDMADAGIHPGPRVVLGGPQINPGEPHASSGSSVQNVGDAAGHERLLDLLEAFGAGQSGDPGVRKFGS